MERVQNVSDLRPVRKEQLERTKGHLGWNSGRGMTTADTYSEDLIIL